MAGTTRTSRSACETNPLARTALVLVLCLLGMLVFAPAVFAADIDMGSLAGKTYPSGLTVKVTWQANVDVDDNSVVLRYHRFSGDPGEVLETDLAGAGTYYPVIPAGDTATAFFTVTGTQGGSPVDSGPGTGVFAVKGTWPSVINPETGECVFHYQDLYDLTIKHESGYSHFQLDVTNQIAVDDGNYGYMRGSTTNGGWDAATWGGGSVHKGYDTTTNKCGICHAVRHRAEGAYYLLRANSQDDACAYCHLGGSAHSNTVVYDLNPAGTDTTNGHTLGASSCIPDSSARQYAQTVTLSGVDCDGNAITETIQVRAYDPAKLQMYRFGKHHGQSDGPEGGRVGYQKIGPLALRCMNCHQVHNAINEVWRPLAWQGAGWPNPTQNLTTFESDSYKLLKRFPSASTTGVPIPSGMYTWYQPGQQTKVIETNAVKQGTHGPWGLEVATYSDQYSAAFVYNSVTDTSAAPFWIAQDIHAPDPADYPTPGTGYYRYPYFVSKYALSFWCADCHNLNIGGWEPLENAELGFKAHTERTHPAPFYGAYTGPGQCYSCHRNDMSPIMGSTAAGGSGRATVTGRAACTQCHFGTKDYAIEMGNESVAGVPNALPDLGLDFPHSGRTTDLKLLGSYTVDVPAGGFTSGSSMSGATTIVNRTITEGNIDAVCLRCHPGVGVHQ